MLCKRFLLPLLLLLLVVACQTQPQGSIQMQHLADADWARQDTLTFQVKVDSVPLTYQLEVLLRLNNDYEYMELPVCCIVKGDSAFYWHTRRKIVVARHPKDFSNQIAGYRQVEALINPQLTFPRAGDYTIKLSPIINKPLLNGVENVGIRLLPAK